MHVCMYEYGGYVCYIMDSGGFGLVGDAVVVAIVWHYLVLLQVELDKFQDTFLLLQDYYAGMEG